MSMKESTVVNWILYSLKTDSVEYKCFFDYILRPKNLSSKDIVYANYLDDNSFEIYCNNGQSVKYALKSYYYSSRQCYTELSDEELDSSYRDIFIVPHDYDFMSQIPKQSKNILNWKSLFQYCQSNGAILKGLMPILSKENHF